MKKLVVFIGEGGSGKTTLIAGLVKRYPEKFKRVVTCISRPIRNGEVNGEDYHFLPKEYFIGNSDLVLTKKAENGHYYGTKKEDLYPSTHHLLLSSRITGIPKLASLGFKNIVVVRISISKKLKIARMRKRGDTEKMISDRLKLDASDNKIDVNLENFPVVGLKASQTLEKNIEIVLRCVND